MTTGTTILAALFDVLASMLFGAIALLLVVVALILWVAVELYRLPACNWRQRDREN